jgi:hypothetical protein
VVSYGFLGDKMAAFHSLLGLTYGGTSHLVDHACIQEGDPSSCSLEEGHHASSMAQHLEDHDAFPKEEKHQTSLVLYFALVGLQSMVLKAAYRHPNSHSGEPGALYEEVGEEVLQKAKH